MPVICTISSNHPSANKWLSATCNALHVDRITMPHPGHLLLLLRRPPLAAQLPHWPVPDVHSCFSFLKRISRIPFQSRELCLPPCTKADQIATATVRRTYSSLSLKVGTLRVSQPLVPNMLLPPCKVLLQSNVNLLIRRAQRLWLTRLNIGTY
jgi:hypothetical protein